MMYAILSLVLIIGLASMAAAGFTGLMKVLGAKPEVAPLTGASIVLASLGYWIYQLF